MTLMSYTPFDMQIDRLFDETVRAAGRKAAAWVPACNAWEDGERFALELALPGWEPTDVKITAEDGVVTVEGTRRGEQPESDRSYFMRELSGGAFSRSFTLPSHVDAEKATASYKHGVLSIEFPKREEAKPRQITIEAR